MASFIVHTCCGSGVLVSLPYAVCSCSHAAQHRPETAWFIRIFIAYFPVSSLWQSLVLGIYIAVVILTWVVQLLRIALSKGPNTVRVSPSAEEGNRSSSKTLCFLVFRILDNGQSSKSSNSECYMPSSEPFRINNYCCLHFHRNNFLQV
jgi:hypothetical protein